MSRVTHVGPCPSSVRGPKGAVDAQYATRATGSTIPNLEASPEVAVDLSPVASCARVGYPATNGRETGASRSTSGSVRAPTTARLVGEHAQAAQEPAEQVALLERGDHAHDGELGAAVGQPGAGLGAAQHLDEPLPGADRHEHGLVGALELVVQLRHARGRVGPQVADVDAEAQAGLPAGEREGLVEAGHLDRRERLVGPGRLAELLGAGDPARRGDDGTHRQVLAAGVGDGGPGATVV